MAGEKSRQPCCYRIYSVLGRRMRKWLPAPAVWRAPEAGARAAAAAAIATLPAAWIHWPPLAWRVGALAAHATGAETRRGRAEAAALAAAISISSEAAAIPVSAT